ncbi:MAG: type IA DNA topoisomerase [Lachnospiraceae bacterium]|nr:type IA DNA topoisomerase [Lachnospiraceae bacterium]
MMKALFIAEKPSVAQEFAKALKCSMQKKNGYLEGDKAVVTWCVGHLVTMSYPEAYDPALKRWNFDTLPFIPEKFLYEVIPSSAGQFKTVSSLLNREDIDTIYVCTDSGREGEYIYRLVAQEAGVKGKVQKRVWIDSQTEEEILRGIREAKDISAYDNLSDAAYLRAKEDYLMGINFSRALTLKYGTQIKNYLGIEKGVISVGRVMTCVLGMVVLKEREIRMFKKTPFYRVTGDVDICGVPVNAQWKATEGSEYFESPKLYKENGFNKKEDAEALINKLSGLKGEDGSIPFTVEENTKKSEKKNPPLLFNLAELQNICSKLFKISPDDTLKVAQELYEKKLTTYPRTDARVLSTAVAKEIDRNIKGLTSYGICKDDALKILESGSYKNIAKTRYVNDKQITDHYAIIPTGQGLGSLDSLSPTVRNIYELIVRRFLSVFYGPAVYKKYALRMSAGNESFFAGFRVCEDEGFQTVMRLSFIKKKEKTAEDAENGEVEEEETDISDPEFIKNLASLKKGSILKCTELSIKEGETSPPKRYSSGSLILAMENAGQLIEDEEMRAQIKGSGIGTSATRAGILEKLFNIGYLNLNKKTQIITPELKGEMVFDVVRYSIGSMLNPKLTASWEMGLSGVADGSVSSPEYMGKLSDFVSRHTNKVKDLNNIRELRNCFDYASAYYKKPAKTEKKEGKVKTGGKSKNKKSV